MIIFGMREKGVKHRREAHETIYVERIERKSGVGGGDNRMSVRE